MCIAFGFVGFCCSFKIPSDKCFKIVFFPLWGPDPVLELLELQIAAIGGAAVRSSIVFCNSVSADRSGMAASRLLGAMAVILFSFAAGHPKS